VKSFARAKRSLSQGISDVAKKRSLEDENAKLKRLLADTMLENVVLTHVIELPLSAKLNL